MTTLAEDIKEFRRQVEQEGPSIDEINDFAIDIHERVRKEIRKINQYKAVDQEQLSNDIDDFLKLLKEIEGRRGTWALDEYKLHRKKHPMS